MTVSVWPRRASFSRSVDFVDFASFCPLANHWYRTSAVAGFHEPAVALRVEPTLATPEITGAARLTIGTSLKWMKPLGQLPLPRVTTAQEKSPPQLSWDTMISSSEITCSTYPTWPAEPAGPVLAFHQVTAPTRGTSSVMRDIEVPQYVALPPPDQGRSFGRPLFTMR